MGLLMTPVPLSRRSSTEHAELGRRTLLVPIGSFEQHGAHLPLTTDSIVAVTVCEDAATQRDVDVAPVIAYSSSGEHEGFAGLLSIGVDVTAATLIEIVRSARPSWKRLVLVNGHGGNVASIEQVLEVARLEGDHVSAWFARDEDGDAHAGASETSFMLAVYPALVNMELVSDCVELPEDWLSRVQRNGVKSISPTGVLGDPASATEDKGHELRRRWCAEVVAMIDSSVHVS